MASLMRTWLAYAACSSSVPAVPTHLQRRSGRRQHLRLPPKPPARRQVFRSRRGPCIQAQAVSGKADKPSLGQCARGLLQLLPSVKCIFFLQLVSQLLRKHFWAVVIIYALKDALQFLLHRVTHRLTNFVAEAVFKYPISEEVINAWWLVLDQEFLQQYPGYQVVMGVLFLVAMPLNLLLSGVASASAVLLCCPDPHPFSSTSQPAAPPAAPTATDAATPASQPAAAALSSNSSSGSAGSAAASAIAAAPSDQDGSSRFAPGQAATAGAASEVSPSLTSLSSDSSSSSSSSGSGIAGSAVVASAASASSTAGASSGMAVEASPSGGGRGLGADPVGSPSSAASPAASTSDSRAASSAAGSSSSAGEELSTSGSSEKKPGWFAPVRRGWQEAFSPLSEVRHMLRRVWWTETVVSVIGLALQAGMMLVVTVPWLLPIYLSAQLAGVTAVKIGDSGLKAIDRSSELMKGRKHVVFWPLLGLILAAKLVDQVKVAAFAAMPQRFWTEAVELPLAAYVLLQLLRVVISRMQDLLPAGVYLHLLQERQADHQAEQAAAPAADG